MIEPAKVDRAFLCPGVTLRVSLVAAGRLVADRFVVFCSVLQGLLLLFEVVRIAATQRFECQDCFEVLDALELLQHW